MKNFAKMLVAGLILLVLGLGVFAGPAVPNAGAAFYVNDFAEVLSARSEDYILDRAEWLYSKTGAQIVVSTVNFMGGETIEDFSHAIDRKSTRLNSSH